MERIPHSVTSFSTRQVTCTAQRLVAVLMGMVLFLNSCPPKAAGRRSVLYSFTGGSDGSQPFAGLIFDNAGNLYGTTV